MTHTNILKTVAIFAACLLLAGTAQAANVNTAANGDALEFAIGGEIEGLTLNVSGPNGYEFQKSFSAGEFASFSLWDGAGAPHADGTYTWAISVQPKVGSAQREALEKARAAGDSVAVHTFEKALGQTNFGGSFAIENGSLVLPTERLGAGDKDIPVLEKDIQHQDDVIIFFSLCVGNDCVNGESFGFDTVRLKENNLRIHFQDTSNSASFPSNDWRIVINGTNNGDANYFAVEDSTAGREVFRVDAGAPSNSLRVDSAGDVGIGESNPVVELHVQDGDSPTLRLEQDGSSGFTPQTFDLVSNEANFFIRDVTNGSQLPFRIKPGADTDALFIAANNNIGVGTDSPVEALHVRRTDANRTSLEIQNANATAQVTSIELINTATAAPNGWSIRNGADGRFSIREPSGTQHLFIDPSDNSWTVNTGMLQSTGANAGTQVCVDSIGKLCICGSCS